MAEGVLELSPVGERIASRLTSRAEPAAARRLAPSSHERSSGGRRARLLDRLTVERGVAAEAWRRYERDHGLGVRRATPLFDDDLTWLQPPEEGLPEDLPEGSPWGASEPTPPLRTRPSSGTTSAVRRPRALARAARRTGGPVGPARAQVELLARMLRPGARHAEALAALHALPAASQEEAAAALVSSWLDEVGSGTGAVALRPVVRAATRATRSASARVVGQATPRRATTGAVARLTGGDAGTTSSPGVAAARVAPDPTWLQTAVDTGEDALAEGPSHGPGRSTVMGSASRSAGHRPSVSADPSGSAEPSKVGAVPSHAATPRATRTQPGAVDTHAPVGAVPSGAGAAVEAGRPVGIPLPDTTGPRGRVSPQVRVDPASRALSRLTSAPSRAARARQLAAAPTPGRLSPRVRPARLAPAITWLAPLDPALDADEAEPLTARHRDAFQAADVPDRALGQAPASRPLRDREGRPSGGPRSPEGRPTASDALHPDRRLRAAAVHAAARATSPSEAEGLAPSPMRHRPLDGPSRVLLDPSAFHDLDGPDTPSVAGTAPRPEVVARRAPRGVEAEATGPEPTSTAPTPAASRAPRSSASGAERPFERSAVERAAERADAGTPRAGQTTDRPRPSPPRTLASGAVGEEVPATQRAASRGQVPPISTSASTRAGDVRGTPQALRGRSEPPPGGPGRVPADATRPSAGSRASSTAHTPTAGEGAGAPSVVGTSRSGRRGRALSVAGRHPSATRPWARPLPLGTLLRPGEAVPDAAPSSSTAWAARRLGWSAPSSGSGSLDAPTAARGRGLTGLAPVVAAREPTTTDLHRRASAGVLHPLWSTWAPELAPPTDAARRPGAPTSRTLAPDLAWLSWSPEGRPSEVVEGPGRGPGGQDVGRPLGAAGTRAGTRGPAVGALRASSFVRALARAEGADEVVDAVARHADTARALSGSLPDDVARTLREVVSRRVLPAEEASTLQAAVAPAASVDQPARERRRRQKAAAEGASLLRSGTRAPGASRAMRLSQKLQGLVHLVERERAEAEAHRRVRRASEPAADAARPDEGSKEVDEVSLATLQREVLAAVRDELEQLRLRSEGGDDVDVWW